MALINLTANGYKQLKKQIAKELAKDHTEEAAHILIYADSHLTTPRFNYLNKVIKEYKGTTAQRQRLKRWASY